MREIITTIAIQTAKWALIGAIISGVFFLIVDITIVANQQPETDKEDYAIIKPKEPTDLNFSPVDAAMIGMMTGAVLGSIFAALKANLGTRWVMLTGIASGLLSGIVHTIYDPTKNYMILVGVVIGGVAWPLFHMRMEKYYHFLKIKPPQDTHFFWPIYGAIIGGVIFEFIPSSFEAGIDARVVGGIIGAVGGFIALIIREAKSKRII